MFHANNNQVKHPVPASIVMYDYKLETLSDEGKTSTNLVEFEHDYSKHKKLIDRKEFSLKAQLESGVNLKQVNVSSLLDPTDVADTQAIEETFATENFSKLESPSNPSSTPETSNDNNE